MAKDKVITVMCAARLPELLVKRMDAAAASGGVSRAQFIAEACRKFLDPPTPHLIERPPAGIDSQELRDAYRTGPAIKPDMEALREICAGKVADSVIPVGMPQTIFALGAPCCAICDFPMREAKPGKWACQDVSCGKYGVEQKVRA